MIETNFNILNDFFQKNQVESPDNIFYAEMHCDQNHPYYFEHPNDHVPGMMMIEFVRQALTACIHTYGNVPLNGYHFILSDLNVKFLNYLELNSPPTVKIILKDYFAIDNTMWTDSIFDTFIYQNGELKAEMSVRNSIMSSRGYKRMRGKNLPKTPEESGL